MPQVSSTISQLCKIVFDNDSFYTYIIIITVYHVLVKHEQRLSKLLQNHAGSRRIPFSFLIFSSYIS